MDTYRNHESLRVAADAAVDMVLPMMQAGLARKELGESGVLYVVLMDPTVRPGTVPFEDAILLERAVGRPREQWDADYGAYARAKARLSWETGLDGHTACVVRPHCARPDARQVWGGICWEGIVAAVSGAFPWYDEAYAGALACAFKACVKAQAQAAGS